MTATAGGLTCVLETRSTKAGPLLTGPHKRFHHPRTVPVTWTKSAGALCPARDWPGERSGHRDGSERGSARRHGTDAADAGRRPTPSTGPTHADRAIAADQVPHLRSRKPGHAPGLLRVHERVPDRPRHLLCHRYGMVQQTLGWTRDRAPGHGAGRDDRAVYTQLPQRPVQHIAAGRRLTAAARLAKVCPYMGYEFA